MRRYALAFALGLCLAAPNALADEFAKADVDHWTQEFDKVVKSGRAAFTDGALGSNGVACAQCHPKTITGIDMRIRGGCINTPRTAGR